MLRVFLQGLTSMTTNLNQQFTLVLGPYGSSVEPKDMLPLFNVPNPQLGHVTAKTNQLKFMILTLNEEITHNMTSIHMQLSMLLKNINTIA
jgi:hypothetical protein